ncbi:hypothetical protein P8452_63005 [Trifolium repens]|nr:hypothetical protein P8452_63005 [Trifolium repens]
MGRHSCCFKQKLRKGLWSPEEDEKLLNHITKYGHGCWSSVPKQAGLQRCGKSCRLRWINYLRPDLKRGTFSQEEENIIIELHSVLGNRWSQIAAQLPGRTDNEIKNLWNSCLKKKLRQKGIDPVTHKPLSEVENVEHEDEKTKSQEKVTEISESDELNLLRSESTSKSDTCSYEQKQSSIVLKAYATEMEVEGSCSNYLMGNYPFVNNDNLQNSNSSHWFNQTGSKPFDMNSEFMSNTFCYKTSFDVPSEDVSMSSSSFPMKNSILSSWGLTDCDSSTKENQTHIHMMENQTEEEEEAKWNEYLQNPMLMLQNQVPHESLCNEIKPATNLSPDALGDMLPHSKQQESSQSYNIPTFGHV